MSEKKGAQKMVADNRKARFHYELLDTFEAGIVLAGTEVKSLRLGKATIGESYAGPSGDDLLLFNADIPEYLQANRFNHERKRPRKLLLHRRQIAKLIGAVQRDGLTIVPTKLYFNEQGRAKIELALARGKTMGDKRETEKKRDWQREKGRLLRDKG
ncbi:SsrA-binding protein [Labrys miyagiensis]|uniref:SsrA-binding protein n=1 Tax=Labrys miyagiensis TaxID=346912 RepID=A0ABQ6D101_9HYPH|nr:SsrA-binding protein SmpB [Labrys miyagiensis]GLS24186.1 SsrA-binding protein [Labrys miyagiensis]